MKILHNNNNKIFFKILQKDLIFHKNEYQKLKSGSTPDIGVLRSTRGAPILFFAIFVTSKSQPLWFRTAQNFMHNHSMQLH